MIGTALALLLATVLPSGSGPVLSEFMALNHATLDDEDGDSSDWIEVTNADTQAIDLDGWFLSDDRGRPRRWAFPGPTVLQPGESVVVFASGKDRAIPGAELHTDFELDADGEYLGLATPQGVIVHEYTPTYPPQQSDWSYGLSFVGGAPGAEETWFSEATPGAPNGVGGPRLHEQFHDPHVPLRSEPLVVTVRADPRGGTRVTGVALRYKVMFDDRVRVAMTDDGTGGDLVAGDGIWTVVLPAGIGGRGEMIRWQFVASDDQGGKSLHPPHPSRTRSPKYFGTMVADPSIQSPLPVYHWFVEAPGLADGRRGTRCSVFHAGRFYENAFVRLRGGSSTGYPKKSYKIEFNPGHHFTWSADAPPAQKVNLNSVWSDKAYLRQALAWRTYQTAGVASSTGFMVRVEQNAGFFSVATFVEQPDEHLLEREGLDPVGALYKMYNQCTDAYSGVEKKTRRWEDHSDLADLVANIRLAGTPLELYLFDNLDVPAVLDYVAATTVMNDNDHVHKNYYLYRDSDGDHEWQFLPWDKDLTFGRCYTRSGGVLNDEMFADRDPWCHPLLGDDEHHNTDGFWNRLIDACHRTPRLRTLYLRRLRTLMDTLLERKSVPSGERWFEGHLEAMYAAIGPDVALDVARWGEPSWGHRRMDFRAALDQLEQQYLNPRRRHLFQTHSEPGGGIVPGRQDHPHLAFGTIEWDPASGDQDEEYVEIVNEGDVAVDLSGWTLEGGISFTFAPGSVVGPHDRAFASPRVETFRSRPLPPTGGEGHLVLGPFEGHIAGDEEVRLLDAEGVRVATTEGAWFSLHDVAAGEQAVLAVIGLAPGDRAAVLASLTGGGPTWTQYGVMDLSEPIVILGLPTADWSGTAEVRLDLPGSAAGVPLWLQAFDLTALRFTSSYALVL